MIPSPAAGPPLRARPARRLLSGVAVVTLSATLSTCQVDKLFSPPDTGTLRVAPSGITDSAALGSGAVRQRGLELMPVATSRIGWQAIEAVGSPWLTLSALSGTAPDTLEISLDPAGLAVGTYRDTVVVSSANSDAAPFRIPVEFMVHPCRETVVPLDQVIGAPLAATDCASPALPGHYARRYVVAAAAGDSLSLELQTTGFDGLLRVDTVTAASPPTAPYPPSLLETDECLGTPGNPCIHYWLVPETRDYVVEVTSTAPGGTGTFALSVHGPRPPLVPDTLAQRGVDSLTAIPPGGTLAESALTLRASVGDPDPVDTLWLEVELREIGVPFSDAATHTSGPGPVDRRAFAPVTGLPDDMGFHWQARTVDQTGRASAWVAAGANPETSPDFTVSIPEDPATPAALAQLRADGVTPIPVNGSTDTRSAVFRGTLTDQDPGDQLRLEVEVVPVGTPFANVATATSQQVASGNTATVTVAALSDNTPYHWQARGVDQSGRGSPWVSFGNNAESTPDFTVLVPATTLVFSVQPSNTVAGAAITPAVEVRALDSQGSTLTSFTGDVTIAVAAPAGAVLSGTMTVAAVAGVATFTNLRPETAGSGWSLSATAASLIAISNTFTVTPGPAARLAFTVQPTNTAAGQVITPPVQVTAQDAFGNTTAGYTGAVTVSLANPRGAILGGATSVNAVAGVATFSTLTVDRAANAYRLNAAAAGLTGAQSNAFDVFASTATRLQFTVEPGNVAAGDPISPAVRVSAVDAQGNVAINFVGTISVQLAANPAGGTLGGTLTQGATSGVATFDDLFIGRAGSGYTLRAFTGGLQPDTSVAFTVNPGAAVGLAFVVQPTHTTAGVVFTPAIAVAAQDAFGNTATNYGSNIVVSIGNNPPGNGALDGQRTVAASAGVATFSLDIDEAGIGYTLTAASGALTGATSATFDIRPAAAVALQFVVQPSNTTAGAVISPAVQVRARDQFFNTATQFTGQVTLAIGANPGGGTLGGTTQMSAVAGVATFANLTIDRTGTGYTLGATAAGLPAATSTAFNIETGGATQLAFIVQPSNEAAGSSIAPAIQVAARDAQGNTVTTFTQTITIAIGVNPPGNGALGGTTSRAAVDGVATFNDLTIDKTGTGYTLIALRAGLVSDESTPFTITPAPASQIAVNAGNNQTATVNTNVAVAPSVIVRDQFNNPVAGVNVTFTVTAGGGSTVPASPTVATTNASGIAAVTSWRMGTQAGTSNNTLTATAAGLAGSPLTFTASATAGPATQVALNAGNNQSATVNTAVAVAPSVIVRDAFNNPVQGRNVTFSVTAGGGSITGGNATTNASGIATVGSWTLGPNAGTNNNTLTATATGLTGSPVTFTASGTAGAATQIALNAGNNQTATVNTAVAVPPSVIVRDAANNPVAGVSVTFAVASGGGSVTMPNRTTDANGVATVGSWTLGTGAGTNNNTLTATSTGLTGSPVTFTASATAGPATQMALNAGDGQSATVNTAVAIDPSVIVTDAFSNPVAGRAVTFAVASGGGSVTMPNRTTDANGVATVGSWTLGTSAGTNNNTLTATSAGLTGSPVTFTASATAGPATQMALNAGNNQSAPVNTAVAIPPSVIVRDAFNNPVAGRNVTFTVTAGGGSTSPASPAVVATNASGIAAVTSWTLGPTAGTNNNTLTAASTGLTGSPVAFTASGTVGSATQIAVNAGNNQSATVNTAVAIAPSVIVRDAANNPVAGVNVTFTVTGGGGSIVPASPAVVVTNASGIAAVTSWTLGTGAGVNNNTLTATASGLTGSPVTFTASATAGPATQMALNAGNNQSATVGTAVGIAPSVIVRDEFNNPVAGRAVTFAVASGGGSVTLPNATSNASGIATVGSWTLGTGAGTNNNTLTATAAGLTGSPVTFTASANAGNATALFFTSQPTNTAAGAFITPAVVVTARDEFSNTATGFSGVVSVAIGTNPPGNGILSGALAAGAVSGIATFSNLSIDKVGTGYTLTASSGALTGATSTAFNITAGVVSASLSTVTASHTTITACASGCVVGSTASTITVTARDGLGNPVSGASVTISSTGAGNAFSPGATGTTNASGVYQADFSSTQAQGKTISAVAGGVAITQNVAITVQPGPAAAMSLNAGNNQSATVNTAVAVDPSVKVTDAFGNVVSGRNVTFTVTAGGGSTSPVSPALMATNPSGVAEIVSWTLGPGAGTNNNTLTATSAGLAGSPITFTASATAGAATQIALNTGNNQTATVNTAVATPPSVIVRDAANNPVSGVSVTFAVTGGGGSVTLPNATTNASGIATVGSWTLGTGAGANNNTLTATSSGLTGSPVTFTASATAGAATQIALNAGNNQTATVNTAVATAPSVIVRDAFNNPVQGRNVTFTVTAGGGSTVPASPAVVATNASGIAAVSSWTLGTSAGTNNNTLTATATGLTGSPVTFTASATAGAATQIAINAGDGQVATAGTAVATPPSVIVRDAFNNPVAGVAVTFAVLSGGGSVDPTAPVLTDASGIAAVTSWTLGATPGTNELTATAASLAGSPVTFTAVGGP